MSFIKGYLTGEIISQNGGCIKKGLLIILVLIGVRYGVSFVLGSVSDLVFGPKQEKKAVVQEFKGTDTEAAFHYNKKKNWKRALKHSLTALEDQPKTLWLNSIAGKSYLELQKPDSAIFYLKKEININKDVDHEFYFLGNALYLKKDYKGAIAQYEKFFNWKNKSEVKTKAYDKAGDAYFELENKAKACECWKRNSFHNKKYDKHCRKKKSTPEKVKTPHSNS